MAKGNKNAPVVEELKMYENISDWTVMADERQYAPREKFKLKEDCEAITKFGKYFKEIVF